MSCGERGNTHIDNSLFVNMFIQPVDMSDSPLLKGYEERKKPKVDKIAKMKSRCYQALMKDFFFNR